MSRRPEQVLEWLRTRPSLCEVQQAFPAEWDEVRRRVAAVVAADDAQAVKAYLASLTRAPVDTPGHRPRRGRLSRRRCAAI